MLKAKHRETLAAYLFLLPNFLGFLIFTFLPIIASLVLSLFQWDILTSPKFIGISNFIKLLGFHFSNGKIVFNDPYFWYYVYNTIFLMLVIPVGIFGSLVLALAMNQKLKGIVFYRTIFFLPTISSGAAIAILWKGLLNPDFGLVNNIISKIGSLIGLNIQGPNWLTDPHWAKPAIMLISLWMTISGYNMILYLAALQGIPRELYEAAEIDGASGWQQFRYITIPMITPTTFFITIMSIIGGLQGGFTLIYILTGGGPAGSTTTIGYYIFNNLYVFQKAGYAACVAWILFLMIFFFTRLYWKYGGRTVNYY